MSGKEGRRSRAPDLHAATNLSGTLAGLIMIHGRWGNSAVWGFLAGGVLFATLGAVSFFTDLRRRRRGAEGRERAWKVAQGISRIAVGWLIAAFLLLMSDAAAVAVPMAAAGAVGVILVAHGVVAWITCAPSCWQEGRDA